MAVKEASRAWKTSPHSARGAELTPVPRSPWPWQEGHRLRGLGEEGLLRSPGQCQAQGGASREQDWHSRNYPQEKREVRAAFPGLWAQLLASRQERPWRPGEASEGTWLTPGTAAVLIPQGTTSGDLEAQGLFW